MQKKKVLFVEDQFLFQNLIEMELSDYFDILLAADHKEAFDQLKKHKVDVILLDLMLPEVNGFDILKQLKKDPEYKKIPVIIVSAKHEDEDFDKAVDLGAASYVTKPFDMNTLKNIIQRELKK